MNEKFYITTAIAYASRKPHFGNTYEVIMTDAIARYKRERGYNVWFCTGTDEHGQKIENLALEAGITPKACNISARRRATVVRPVQGLPTKRYLRGKRDG